jgi:hypothetical protein
MLHRFSEEDRFGRRMHEAELVLYVSAPRRDDALAENYVGLPYRISAASAICGSIGPNRASTRTVAARSRATARGPRLSRM